MSGIALLLQVNVTYLIGGHYQKHPVVSKFEPAAIRFVYSPK
jgi:hypothetical protein